MALKIELHWQQTANYVEEIELNAETVVKMDAAGVDFLDVDAVFNWLNDRDRLIAYEPVDYDRAELDQGSSHFTVLGFAES